MKLIPPEEIILSNGIPVILQNYNGAAAATYWWIKTGSADEKPAEAGFAHFLEHMLFKDAAAKETGRASSGQLAQMIESLGGDINAYTSFDQTVYHVTCAAHHWERVIDSFGTMAKPQKFLKEDFTREREVILEELRKNEDSPSRQMFQELFTRTYQKHPYGKPVIGFVKTLKAANVAQLEAFRNRRYVSENMGLILVGPLGEKDDPRRKRILATLEKRFGKRAIARKPLNDPNKRAVEPQLRKDIESKVLEFAVQTPSLSLSFRVPEIEHEDSPALDLLVSILGMGELGRLYQKLFYGKSLVTDVSAGIYVPKDPGLVYFEADYEDLGKTQEIVDAMLTEIDRIKNEGPISEEIKRCVTNAESERLYATQSADGMAGRIGFLRFVLGDMAYDERYLEELRAVDARRIQEVARRYLTADRLSVVMMVPKGKKAEAPLDAIVQKCRASLTPAPQIPTKTPATKKTGKSPLASSPAEEILLPNGVRVLLCERPQSHVFSMQAAALGGVRLEPEAEHGVSHVLSDTWTKGTKKRSAHDISAIVEGSAGSIEGFSGRNSLGLQVTGLNRDFDTLSSLFWEILTEPSFPTDEIQHTKRVTEDSIRSIEDSSGQLCSKLFLETLFQRHPYRRYSYGTLDSLSRISSETVKRAHARWIKPENLVIGISGPISKERFMSRFEKQMGNWRGEPVKASNDPQILDEPPLAAPRWVERNLGREQVHVIVGGIGLKIHSDERYSLRLLQNLLSGQSGRLFVELREKKSLAYTVSPMAFEGIERGYIGTYIACAPSKRQEAIDGIRGVLERLASKGPTPAEMKRAQEFYLGRRAMDFQTDSALSTHFCLEALYKLDILPDDEIARRIRKVSPKSVADLCRRLMVEAPQVVVAVG